MATAVASQMEETEKLTAEDMKGVGLVDAHAYSLIAAKEIVVDGGKKVNLLQIRNPWGKKEWTGDWSDRSPLWTETCKQQVNYQDKDDGCFWISFDDYIKFFYITTICYYNENFVPSIVCDEHAIGGYGVITFKIETTIKEPVVFTID